MANDTTENLRVYLLTSSDVRSLTSGNVHQNQVPQNRKQDYIWLRLASRQPDHCLDDETGAAPRALLYDCECCSSDLDRSVRLSDAVRALAPYRGSFGDSTVKGVFVNDQDEDYQPVNDMGDIGIHIQTLQIEVCP